jgi:hypothetical protein
LTGYGSAEEVVPSGRKGGSALIRRKIKVQDLPTISLRTLSRGPGSTQTSREG